MFFVGGLLGSAHCVGMCGSFVLALGYRPGGWTAAMGRQVVYGLGRVFTYSTGGMAAGYAGWRLAGDLHLWIGGHALLAFVAGSLLVVQGLSAAGVLRLPARFASRGPCLLPSMFAALLRETRMRNVFLGGAINGLMPCGLVYAYLALAASSGSPLRGGLTMLSFGLGTLPILALIGCGARLVAGFTRRTYRVAAWCVVLTGALSIARGVEAARSANESGESSCPFCRNP